MANVFETAWKDRCVDSLDRAFGVTVTLRSGQNTTEEFTARRVRHHETLQSKDVPISVNLDIRRYVIPQSIVDSTSWLSDPKPGMEIIEGNETFRIVPKMDGSKKAVEYDSGVGEYIVNCEKVG